MHVRALLPGVGPGIIRQCAAQLLLVRLTSAHNDSIADTRARVAVTGKRKWRHRLPFVNGSVVPGQAAGGGVWVMVQR